MEQQISTIWSQILHLKAIPSITTNFFQLGGNSLLLMKLHHRYQTQFHQSINISNLFRHATISDHAQLLETQQTIIQPEWHSFIINKGIRSLKIDMKNTKELRSLGGFLTISILYQFQINSLLSMEIHFYLKWIHRE
jgi:aryl carrier-like protein